MKITIAQTTYHFKIIVMSAESCAKWRRENVKYSYNNLKGRAKQRGIEFTLTFEQFRRFCVKTKYIQNKGRTVDSYTIDRKDPRKGYTIRNIRILPLHLNAGRRKILDYDWCSRTATVVEYNRASEENIF